MEVTVEVFKYWGLGGIAVLGLVVAIRYVVAWLRQVQEKSDTRQELNLQLFLKDSAEQRKEFRDSLDKVVTRFEGMHQMLGAKVDNLGEEVQELAGKIR